MRWHWWVLIALAVLIGIGFLLFSKIIVAVLIKVWSTVIVSIVQGFFDALG